VIRKRRDRFSKGIVLGKRTLWALLRLELMRLGHQVGGDGLEFVRRRQVRTVAREARTRLGSSSQI
jgi:hypothetical protein